MSAVTSDTHLRIVRARAQEDGLISVLSLARPLSLVDGHLAIHFSSILVEFNSLPCVLSSLGHRGTVLRVHRMSDSRLLSTLSPWDIPFNLVFAEPQRQVQLKRVVLATLWFVEPTSCFIKVIYSTARRTIRGPPRVR